MSFPGAAQGARWRVRSMGVSKLTVAEAFAWAPPAHGGEELGIQHAGVTVDEFGDARVIVDGREFDMAALDAALPDPV